MTDQERWVRIEEIIRETKYPKHDPKAMTGVTYIRLNAKNWTRLKPDTIIVGVVANYVKICKLKRRS